MYKRAAGGTAECYSGDFQILRVGGVVRCNYAIPVLSAGGGVFKGYYFTSGEELPLSVGILQYTV